MDSTDTSLQYVSIYNKDTGERETSYVTGVHGDTIEDLKAKAAEEYPQAETLEQTAEEYAAALNNGKLYLGGVWIDRPEPTEEELKKRERASLKHEYDTAVNDLNNALSIANLNGDDEAVASVRSEFADLQAAYKEAVEEVG